MLQDKAKRQFQLDKDKYNILNAAASQLTAGRPIIEFCISSKLLYRELEAQCNCVVI